MMDEVQNALESQISRIVAALTPVLAGLIGALLLWLQNVLGIDLQVDPAVAAAFVGTIILGGCLTGLQWLRGRALYESTALRVAALHAAGASAMDEFETVDPNDPDGEGTKDVMGPGDEPVVPPGLSDAGATP